MKLSIVDLWQTHMCLPQAASPCLSPLLWRSHHGENKTLTWTHT